MVTRRRFMHSLGTLAVLGATGLPRAFAGETILTLRGGAAGTASFDLAGLDALPQTAFQTSTPWSQGVVAFSGVSLRDCFAACGGGAAGHIRLVALNDYVVDADLAELVAADALLATRQNGAPMPISDKGPIFLVFPFDGRRELQHQIYYSRAVWQLAEIDIVA